jgi:hypothetical protein
MVIATLAADFEVNRALRVLRVDQRADPEDRGNAAGGQRVPRAIGVAVRGCGGYGGAGLSKTFGWIPRDLLLSAARAAAAHATL